MNKNEAVEVLRKAFLQIKDNGKIDNQIGKKLYEAISGVVQVKYSSLGSDDQKDLVNQSFIGIYNSMSSETGNSVWLENSESNPDSDKILINYFYTIIRTAFYEIQPVVYQRETLNLESAIRNILNKLVSEKYLCKNSRNEFCRNEGAESIHHIEIKGYFYSIQNKNGNINHSELEKLIRSFFDDELENYAISLSNLVRLITDISDYGNAGYISISGGTLDNDEEENKNDLPNSDNIYNPEFISEVESIAKQWLSRVESSFAPDELHFYAKLYYYKFGLSLTLEEIEEKIGHRYRKSSIDNFVKMFIKTMRISEVADINSLELKVYLDFFMSLLIKKLNLTESEGENSDE